MSAGRCRDRTGACPHNFMVRLRQELGFALLLAAGLCLSAHESSAQNVPPNPSVPAKAAAQQKAHPHRKKAAPDPPPAQAPAPTPTLEQSAPTPPQVTYNNGQLTIIAHNATLSQVLRSVQSQTGGSIEMPASASNERVVDSWGPGCREMFSVPCSTVRSSTTSSWA